MEDHHGHNMNMENIKAQGSIELLNLAEETNYTFYILGLFPKKLEFDQELSYDETSGWYTYSLMLSFDDIYFEKDGIQMRSFL